MTNDLRQLAVQHSFFKSTTLRNAVNRLGFVQADPIRSPARAQDLILRHRVKNYFIDDLERKYPSLDLEEDYLYAYGFLPQGTFQLLSPQKKLEGLTKFDKNVLKVLRESGIMHPRDLDEHFEPTRVKNAWGGYSKATKRSLELLHRHGLVRVARRENGIRVYEATSPSENPLAPLERYRCLILILVQIFSPASEKTINALLARLRRMLGDRDAEKAKKMLNELVTTGELTRHTIDGINYLTVTQAKPQSNQDEKVRILAPFDPLVWDRTRFEHFWSWRYRFEAYTPAEKRERGYYAMPLLWNDDVIGWVNVQFEEGIVDFDIGYVDGKPRSRDYKQALEQEMSDFEDFLRLQ